MLRTRRLTTPSPESGTHIPVLDGIRGAAILLVLLQNLYPRVAPVSATDVVVMRIADGAWIGVDLFFVLSGFLDYRDPPRHEERREATCGTSTPTGCCGSSHCITRCWGCPP